MANGDVLRSRSNFGHFPPRLVFGRASCASALFCLAFLLSFFFCFFVSVIVPRPGLSLSFFFLSLSLVAGAAGADL